MLEPRARFLIVCEGGKTEPIYFRALCKDQRLTAAEVRVCGEECGSHPGSVVASAKQERDEAREPFDHVWCVFDRDEHEGVESVREDARQSRLHVAFSNPCFEIWFRLHFEFSTAPIERDDVISDLGKPRFLGAYEKSADVYPDLLESQPTAIANARKLRKYHNDVNEGRPENPYTDVDVLVTELSDLAAMSLPTPGRESS